eukprot:scaffold67727_cov66-Phaeocystis_antarctica.AAC.4
MQAPGCPTHSGRTVEPPRAQWQAAVRPHVQLLEERTADGTARLTLGVDDGEDSPLPVAPRGGPQLGRGDNQLAALNLHALPHGWHALAAVGSGGRTSFYVNGRLQGVVPRQ